MNKRLKKKMVVNGAVINFPCRMVGSRKKSWNLRSCHFVLPGSEGKDQISEVS